MSEPRIGAAALRALLGEWEDGRAVYVALAERVRLLIADGRVPARTRLPAERELAAALGRSRTTVAAAYRALRESGHLVSVRGSGSAAALPAAEAAASSVVDFARAMPPAVPGLDAIVRRALDDLPAALAAPGFDLVGDPGLRARIADRYTARGLPTTPEQIVVTLGAQHALGLCARTLVRRGDRVLVEIPTYPYGYEAFGAAGARLVGTPVTRDGWDVGRLRDVLARTAPTAAYLIPDFHNPTGASMPPADRDRVHAAARRAGTTLVVDETTADLDLGRPPGDGPFATRPGVVTVGSLGKSVWGGLRIGWIRADPGLLARVVAARAATDLGTPALEQRIAAAALDELPALLAVRTAELRERRDVLTAALRARFPDWDVPDADGGVGLWVGLDAPAGSVLAAAAQARGLAINAGARFTIDGSCERFLRVPFTAPVPQITRGVGLLAEAWTALRDLTAAPHGSRRAPDVI